DVAGNELVNSSSTFFVLCGDANRDRAVDTLDFNLLATNFGQSGHVFSEGDFNYDGFVDTLDFNLLSANFTHRLGAAPAAAASSPIRSGSGSAESSDLFTAVDDPLI